MIVASFASHIHRIQQVMDTAARHGRSLAVIGRSMVKNVNIAANLGYLNVPDGLLIKPHDIALLPADRVTILSTGSQGEPLSALARMASRDHPLVEIQKGDTVVISARAVPGNETSVYRTIDRLFAAGARVIYESSAGVHVSGPRSRGRAQGACSTWYGPSTSCPCTASTATCISTPNWPGRPACPQRTCSFWRTATFWSWRPTGPASPGKVQAGHDSGRWVRDGRLQRSGPARPPAPGHRRPGDHRRRAQSQDGQIVGEPEVVFRGFAHAGDLDELTEKAKKRVVEALGR